MLIRRHANLAKRMIQQGDEHCHLWILGHPMMAGVLKTVNINNPQPEAAALDLLRETEIHFAQPNVATQH